MQNEQWIAGAVEALVGGAIQSPTPNSLVPRQKIARARSHAKSTVRVRAQPDSGGQHSCGNHINGAPGNPIEAANAEAGPELGGQLHGEHHRPCAAQTLSVDGHRCGAAQNVLAIDGQNSGVGQGAVESQAIRADTGTQIAQIVENWRRRQDMLRARMRLELQAQAICRRSCDGDKTAAAKLWAEVKKNPAHPLRQWLEPFLISMVPLDAAKSEIERQLAKSVKKLPIYAWSKDILGLGEVSLAGIIGECGVGPGEYRTVSALWKRMGMAVINGGRQRKVSGAEALDHGYSADRRSLMWNIGGSLMKAQLRSEKGEDGKKVDGGDFALGDLGQVYLDRKAKLREMNDAGLLADRAARIVESAKKRGEKPHPENEAGRLSPIHIHNDAKRYMEKRLLRELWKAWRRAMLIAEPNGLQSAAELREEA